MADKKEVNILLLGIVAILAIVGLVLLFTSPAATGKASWFPPSAPAPDTQVAYGGQQIVGGGYTAGGAGNAILVSSLEASNVARCPGGKLSVRMQGNIRYDVKDGFMCSWFNCPGLETTIAPVMACAPLR